MKKILLAVVVALFSINAMAQHEIGGIVGGMNGLSYKYWVNDKFAVQADLAVGLSRIYQATYFKGTKIGSGDFGCFDFTINPNALYHFDLVNNLKLYTGGGISFGLVSDLNNTNTKALDGKFGINGVIGLAYELDAVPLVLAFDLRPGYGLGFQTSDDAHMSYFDWHVGFAVRYKL